MSTNKAQALILVVEDEINLSNVVCEYLQHNGYRTAQLSDGSKVIDWIKSNRPHLLILDLMLPHQDGLSIYRELRQFSDIPVIMATAKVNESDRLAGLGLGADDYICKPYSPRELVMRVHNILRRIADNTDRLSPSPSQLLSIDEQTMSATLAGTELVLTPVEYRLLTHFFKHPGQVFNREQLMNELYDDYRIISDRTVDSHIKNLRKKLTDANPDAQTWIQSVYGIGYRWQTKY